MQHQQQQQWQQRHPAEALLLFLLLLLLKSNADLHSASPDIESIRQSLPLQPPVEGTCAMRGIQVQLHHRQLY
jgi:hypothetical protein